MRAAIRFVRNRRWFAALLSLAVLAGLAAAVVVWLNVSGEAALSDQPLVSSPAQIERGAYLATAGNCAACHTARGGQAYAGGRPIDTPFGQVLSSNLTSDKQTGIGSWTPAQFWRAMHHGRSRDGRLLYPVFPYENYTLITRADSDALLAYLSSVPPAAQPNQPHRLRFPYNTQAALAVWRAVGFRAGGFEPVAGKSEQWNRGAYLVRGLAHCTACHSERNTMGAITARGEYGGGFIDMEKWYAPSLLDVNEASVSAWETGDIVHLLRTGMSRHGSALGPMAEVVFRSTQHLTEPDLNAIAHFMKDIPGAQPAPQEKRKALPQAQLRRGPKLYEQHCADCHGDNGEGRKNLAGVQVYPALAGNRAVSLEAASNVIQVVLRGGFGPATAGNPRPYGMPPFRQTLSDTEAADIITFIRQSWGNSGSIVSEQQVQEAR